jgi:hypothetical protein
MKSKLGIIGVVSVILGQLALAGSSASAQATAEGSSRTIPIQYTSSADAPGSASSANATPLGAAASGRMSYQPGAGPANNQSTISSQQLAGDPPTPLPRRNAGRESDSARDRGVLEAPPCLGAGHFYVASVVNSVSSSCFLGNQGPGPLGGAF